MKISLAFYQRGKIVRELSLAPNSPLTIGRREDNGLVLADPRTSGRHAEIEFRDGGLWLTDVGSTNGTSLNGVRLGPREPVRMNPGDQVNFPGDEQFALVATHLPEMPAAPVAPAPPPPSATAAPSGKDPHSGPSGDSHGPKSLQDWLERKNVVTIGRSEECDIVLDSLRVSRQHAQVEKTPQGIRVTDLGSKNGTFINQKLVTAPVLLQANDRLEIGPYLFVLQQKAVVDLRRQGYAIRAHSITKVYGRNDNGEEIVGLQPMTLKVPAQEFVALMGPSGCGKSTLLKCLNGDNPATKGEVLIHGHNLAEDFSYLKRYIGYVPQDDIVHRDLSVDKTLYYAAKLRLDADVSEEDIWKKIEEVLSKLNINDPKIRGNKVRELSGGQRKRVSIAVELLSEPSILFLDEPTSPLDPETIEEFLNSIRKLVDTGMTVIMVTHKPEDLNYVDKVIFLSTKGYMTYYGDKDDFLAHFNKKNIIEVYSLLSKKENGIEWNQRWRSIHTEEPSQVISPEKLPDRKEGSLLRQFWWLCRRYLNIKLNDQGNMALLLAQPVIIAILIGFIFDKLQLGVLFMMAISAVWFGVSNAAKEIVEEQAIYKRERMFNMSIFTYLFSKISILAIIAFVQVVLFVGIVYAFYHFNAATYTSNGSEFLIELRSFWPNVGFMFYLSISATMIGLLLSSLFSNTEKVMTVVPIALIPQIMLAGVLASIDNPIKEGLSYLTLGRWGTEGFCRLQDGHTDAYIYDRVYRFGSDEVEEEKRELASIFMQSAARHDTTVSLVFEVKHPITGDTEKQRKEIELKNQPKNELEFRPTEALPNLKFYGEESKCTLQWFDSLSLNLLAISLLNLGIFIGIYRSLKQKDSL
jgi:ABC-type multidrug transport system ATPase subunit